MLELKQSVHLQAKTKFLSQYILHTLQLARHTLLLKLHYWLSLSISVLQLVKILLTIAAVFMELKQSALLS